MLNQNIAPYYDDFNPNKKFLKFLFVPGHVIQARELTQLQTMLQNQIQSFGNNVFKNGTIITGCAESHNFTVPYVKIKDTDGNNTTITTDISTFEGQVITCSATGVSAIIKKTVAGSEAENPNLKTLYVQYLSNDSATGTVSEFSSNDILSIGDALGTFVVADVALPTGEGSLFSLNDGIVYANGMFVVHSEQTIVIDPYNASGGPTQNVGFILDESFVTSDDDSTLLDPAQGSYNAKAPGADRYKVSTILTSYDPAEDKPDGFFLLFTVTNGVISRSYETTQYGQLAKELAQRTYDESGDYVVEPFSLIVSEHLNNSGNSYELPNHGKYLPSGNPAGDVSKLVVAVGSGKAYVQGYEHELHGTKFIDIDKGIDTQTSPAQYISTSYGNYVEVNEVSGAWNIASGEIVNFTDTATQSVTNGTYSAATHSGSALGTAKVRNIEYVSGTGASAIYHLYLYDIKMTAGSFENIRTIYCASSIAANADPVIVSSKATLKNTKYPNLLFPLTKSNTKELDNISYTYRKQFSGIAASTVGAATFTVSGDEEFAFSTTDADTIKNNVIIIAESDIVNSGSSTVYKKGQYIDVSGSVTTTTGAVTSLSTTSLSIDITNYNLSSQYTLTAYINVKKTASPNPKTLKLDRFVRIETASNVGGATGPYQLGVHDLIGVQNVWVADGVVAAPGYPAIASDSNWTDVTSDFTVDNNITDSEYGLATMSTSNTYTNKTLIVRLSYYEHGNTSGYYSAQSYPLPAVNAEPVKTGSSPQVNWYDIPKYTTNAGITYDLRDTLDFRSTLKLTSGTALNPYDAIANQAVTTTTRISSSTIPNPSKEYIADITYFLPRIDRIVIDGSGDFLAVRGDSSLTPVKPDQPDNSMTLGFVTVPAYPSLSPYYARIVDRAEYGTSIAITDNKRFTMQNINNIDERLKKLEYYTSLSLLEQSAASMFIPNATTGADRFKNGILVDSFNGHNVGNVFDENYKCSIFGGELRPAFTIQNVGMEVSDDSSNITTNSNTGTIVVRQLLSNAVFVAGDQISGSGTGLGTINHAVTIAQDNTYRWVRVYMDDVTGSFAETNTINGISTNSITYAGMTESTLSTNLRPPLVTTPADSSLATLPYSNTIFTKNLYASKSRNCASPILFTFEGNITLDPPVDMWIDTAVLPEIQSNTNGFYDNWVHLSNPWGTQWENWNTLWQRNLPIQDVTIDSSSLISTAQQRQTKEGIALFSALNEEINIVPYIRSQVITFTASQLKGNTRLYPFFDGVDVSDYCRSGVSNAIAFGTPLITASDGTLTGQFRIPSESFTAGSKIFVLTSDANDPVNPEATAVATGIFTVSGVSSYEERSVVSTQKPTVTYGSQNQTQNLVVDRQVSSGDLTTSTDPMAQTFFVSNSPNGVLATRAEIYFASRSARAGITLQIREVINGVPSETILPYSSVSLSAAEVNISSDASAPTIFEFSSPVYLKNNSEYCLALIPDGNNDEYSVWVSELGKINVGTTMYIDNQPNAGTLFGAGNNRTWVEFPNEDMKFALYTATFNPAVSGKLIAYNSAIDYLQLTPSSNSVPTPLPGDVISSLTGTGIGVITYYDKNSKIAEVKVTSGTFSATDSASGFSITRIKKIVNAVSPAIGFLNFNNTSLSWGYKIYGFDGTAYNASAGAGYSDLSVAGTTEFVTENAIFSYSEHNETFSIMGELSTTASNISPIIDLTKFSVITVANSINSSNSGETGNSGSAYSRYITRAVVLDDGQDAEDLQVYLSASLPAGSNVSVYAKLLNGADSSTFEDRPWTPMTQNLISGTGEFKEYYFTLPTVDNNSTSGGGGGPNGTVYGYTTDGSLFNGFKTFAVKIVPLATPNNSTGLTTNIPRVRDLRVIALQV